MYQNKIDVERGKGKEVPPFSNSGCGPSLTQKVGQGERCGPKPASPHQTRALLTPGADQCALPCHCPQSWPVQARTPPRPPVCYSLMLLEQVLPDLFHIGISAISAVTQHSALRKTS